MEVSGLMGSELTKAENLRKSATENRARTVTSPSLMEGPMRYLPHLFLMVAGAASFAVFLTSPNF